MASGEHGGGADHLVGLLPELVELGTDCAAAVGSDGPLRGRLRQQGIDVHHVELMHSRVDPLAAARLGTVATELSPDIVHTHGTRAAFYWALARIRCPHLPPAVYTAHGLAFRKSDRLPSSILFHAAEAVACRGAAHVISVSRRDLDDLIRRRLVPVARGTHVPNAVDVRRFAGGDRAAARERLALPADGFVVGTVSRLVAQKSVGDLVAAVERCPGAHLVVVGDGDLRARVEAGAVDLGKRAHFLGARDDVPQILPAFDVFALSSRWEGEPIALLEAMAAGLPIVATATEGAVEILADSGAGLLVEIGSPEGLATAITRLMERPDDRRRMGEVGRRLVAGRSWARAASAVDGVYRGVLRL